MGAAFGCEGTPKQAGAVIANAMSDQVSLSDESGGCWLPAALGPEWRQPMGRARLPVHCSHWRCCVACLRCADNGSGWNRSINMVFTPGTVGWR
jgi:hypothetical protein